MMTAENPLTTRFAREALDVIQPNGIDHRRALIDRIANLPDVLTASALEGLVSYSNAINPGSPGTGTDMFHGREEVAIVLLVMNAVGELPEAELPELRRMTADALRWSEGETDLRTRLWQTVAGLTMD